MSTNTQTHYLLEKKRHLDALRRAQLRVEQATVLANGALEDAALNFMRACPDLTMCIVMGRQVEFWNGDRDVLLFWAHMPVRLRARVAAFERDFVKPFKRTFPGRLRDFRIDREGDKLTVRRKW